MNAADITHGLKLLGGGTRMWVGVLVVALVFAAVSHWLSDVTNRQAIKTGLFA
jgi:hypothetical protein